MKFGQVARRTCLQAVAVAVMAPACAGAARAQVSEGREILDRVEKLLWGTTVQGDYEMTITTPRWQRTLGLKLWMERPKR